MTAFSTSGVVHSSSTPRPLHEKVQQKKNMCSFIWYTVQKASTRTMYKNRTERQMNPYIHILVNTTYMPSQQEKRKPQNLSILRTQTLLRVVATAKTRSRTTQPDIDQTHTHHPHRKENNCIRHALCSIVVGALQSKPQS